MRFISSGEEFTAIAKSSDSLMHEKCSPGFIAIYCLHFINQYPVFVDRYNALLNLNLWKWAKRFSGHFIRNFSKLLIAFYQQRVVQFSENDNCDIIFVSHFLNSRLPSTEDLYFGALPTDLQEAGYRVKVLLIDHTEFHLKKSPQAIFPPNKTLIPRILSLKLEWGFLMLGIRNSFSLLNVATRKKNVDRSVACAAACEALSPETIQALRLHRYLHDLLKVSKPRHIFITWEGHSWERLAFHAARQAVSGIKCIGYQHSVLQQYSYAPFRSLGDTYDPDIILTTGKIPAQMLSSKMDFKRTAVVVYGSHRNYSGSGNLPEINNAARCIFLPQGEEDECLFMIEFLRNAATAIPTVQFVLRLHPILDFDEFVKKHPHLKKMPSNVKISSEKDITKELERCIWAIYRGTIACFQAIQCNVRPIYLVKPDTLQIDPLYLLTHWKRTIVTVTELDLIFREDRRQLSLPAGRQEWESALEFCHEYTQKPSLASVMACLHRPMRNPPPVVKGVSAVCGIFQVISRNKPVLADRFTEALALMKHRGPDHTGVYFHPPLVLPNGESIHIASGHQRLSILDLNERAHQPFFGGNDSIIFNGEIYNYKNLKIELGDFFYTNCDTEVLLHGLHKHGQDFISKMNGMWAFSFIDSQRRRLLMSRDRYGKKPLFIFFGTDIICASSTIQAIYHYLATRPKISDSQVDSFLIYGMLFPQGDGTTHMEGISQVVPGTTLEIDLDTWTSKSTQYFSMPPQMLPPSSEEMLPAVLREAVITRLISDRKVGLLLSGGVDSSLILAVIHASGLQDQVHCYIGEGGHSDDADYAKRCVKQLGIEASVLNLGSGSDAFSRFLGMCAHQEKPFPLLGSTMAMSEMYQHISEDDVRVVLDGTGGDEIFGGYWDRHYPFAIRDAISHRDWPWLWDSFRQNPGFSGLVINALRKYLPGTGTLRTYCNSFNRNFGLNPFAIHSPDPLANGHMRFTDALAIDASPGGRLGEWIWHNDRNAMMYGVENRSPLLDIRLTPYLATGYSGKFRGQWNKYQLRNVFDAFSPLPTQWRIQKQGFRWNLAPFLKDNKQAVLDLIDSSKYLSERFDMKYFADKIGKNESLFFSNATARVLCIAGIDEKMRLAVP